MKKPPSFPHLGACIPRVSQFEQGGTAVRLRTSDSHQTSVALDVPERFEPPRSVPTLPRVVMLVSNPFDPDPRVLREAKSLVQNGIPVEVIGWDRLGSSKEREVVDGIEISRIRVASGYSDVGVVAGTLPLFWASALRALLSRRIDIVHCHDFDTLPVGIILKALKGCSVVFDAHEFYPSYVRDKVSRPTYLAVKALHATLYRKADVIFTVSDRQKSLFRHKRVEVIPNLPNLQIMENERRTRGRLDTFAVFYYGNLTPDRGIDQILEIPRLLPSAEVVLSGRGPLEERVISASERDRRVKYLGWITPAEIERNLASSDYVSILYDPKNMNNATGLPNKLFESLKFGVIPVVPEGTAMARLVRAEAFGLVVPYGDVPKIAEALQKLESEPEAKAKMRNAGIDVFQKQYNWQVAEARLLSIYRRLMTR